MKECSFCGATNPSCAEVCYNCDGHEKAYQDYEIKRYKSGYNIEKTNEENKMELKNMNKENLKEAREQFETENRNYEIEQAKQLLRQTTDELDRLDRVIRSAEEQKKPYLEVLSTFGIKRK